MAGTASKTMIALVASLVVVVIGYFVYDRMRNPCESIFEQARTKLNAKIDILKNSGAVSIGNDKIQDLSERSQMVALNLKTCCIVFDGGRLNSAEFFKCKQGVERYQTQVTQVINVVADAQAARFESNPRLTEEKLEEATRIAVQASKTAAGYQKEVALISSRAPAASGRASTTVGGSESEPNNSALEANVIAASGSTFGEITESTDVDWFLLRPDSKVRDWLLVTLENRSQALQPYLIFYDKDKNKIGEQLAGTPGANLNHRIVLAPGGEIYARVGARWAQSSGTYALASVLSKAYDKFEPNDDSFSATQVGPGTTISANIMEGADVDWYLVPKFRAGTMNIRLENRSTQLQPWIHVYDGNKRRLHESLAANGGESLDIAIKVTAEKDYFLALGARWGSSYGEYRLTVAPGK